jgi:L-lysine exporter family protein LysE/ArgO
LEWIPAAITGFSIGLAFTAVPGPVTTEATRRSVSGGFWPGFWVNLGSCIGDIFWAALGLSGAAVFLRHDSIAVVLGLVGVAFLFGLARSAIRESSAEVRDDGSPHHGNAFRVGMTFSFANPSGIAFWSGIGTGMLAGLGSTSVTTITVLIAAYLIAGMLLGCTFVAIAALGGRLLGQRVMRWVNLASGVALSWFCIRLAWTTLQRARLWLLPLLRTLS